jgi:type IV pilus assembly protein PilB
VAVRKRLGEILLDEGVITQDQLKTALSQFKETGLKLGEYLALKGIVSENIIVDAVASQMNLRKFDAGEYDISPDLAQIMDVDNATKFKAVPVKKSDGVITIAMTDPLNIITVDYIEVMTDMEVETVICTEQNFNYLMSAIYGAYAGKDGVMQQVQDISEMDSEPDDDEGSESLTETDLQHMAEDAPVIKLVNSILTQAVREGATDIHLSPEKTYIEIRFRVDGKLHKIPNPPKKMFLPMVSRIKIMANLDISISRIPQDGRMTIKVHQKEVNVRVSTIPTIYGENVVLRLLDTSSGIHTLDQLGYSADDIAGIKKMIKMPYGMILCTGPTGSGKSTSLFAMLKEINSPDTHIITLEDPVEYRMEHIRQAQLNRRAGMTFASGLRSILRQDPDVIMVGEIRDTETANVAVQAALTGHMVFSTVHTNDAAGAVTRFIEMGVAPFLVSSVMLVIIAQRLVRRVCTHCGEQVIPPPELLEYWGIPPGDSIRFMKAKGCSHCLDTGYRGRVGLYEILYIDDAVRDMILSGKTAKEISRLAHEAGQLRTLKEDAARKVMDRITTPEEAMSALQVK